MTMSHHRLPREIFAGLASGGGGYEAVRELAAAEFSKHVILLRGCSARRMAARSIGQRERAITCWWRHGAMAFLERNQIST
jgi:hypothetical protein